MRCNTVAITGPSLLFFHLFFLLSLHFFSLPSLPPTLLSHLFPPSAFSFFVAPYLPLGRLTASAPRFPLYFNSPSAFSPVPRSSSSLAGLLSSFAPVPANPVQLSLPRHCVSAVFFPVSTSGIAVVFRDLPTDKDTPSSPIFPNFTLPERTTFPV